MNFRIREIKTGWIVEHQRIIKTFWGGEKVEWNPFIKKTKSMLPWLHRDARQQWLL